MAFSRPTASAMLGGFLEFYDFTLYGFLIKSIQTTFFPFLESDWGLLNMYLVFGVGFFARPLGALVFGTVGDKYGRKVAFSASLILMSVSTLCMGILPGYEILGIYAPILIIFSRLLQGISAGGEYSGGMIFALEHAKQNQKGLTAGLVASGCMLGIVFASVTAYFLQKCDLSVEFWRFAFIFGFVVSLVGIYVRLQLLETNDFLMQASKKSQWPVVLKQNYRLLLFLICITGFNGVVLYSNTFCMSLVFKKMSEVSPGWMVLCQNMNSLFLAISLICLGWVSDRVDKIQLMMIGIVGTIVWLAIFYALASKLEFSPALLLVCQITLALVFSVFSSPMNSFLVGLFKTNQRARCFSLGYNVGMGFLGGSAPFLTHFLMGIHVNLFLGYLFVLGILSIAGLFVLQSKGYDASSKRIGFTFVA
ncbi:MAG: MFS transporter [Gammaproteobacteria bacterium]